MEQSEVYTALQQGVIDAAENSELVYRDFKNYEVAPYYAYTRHIVHPNVVPESDSPPSPAAVSILWTVAASRRFSQKKWQERIQKNRCNPWLGRLCLCFRTFYAFFTLMSG